MNGITLCYSRILGATAMLPCGFMLPCGPSLWKSGPEPNTILGCCHLNFVYLFGLLGLSGNLVCSVTASQLQDTQFHRWLRLRCVALHLLPMSTWLSYHLPKTCVCVFLCTLFCNGLAFYSKFIISSYTVFPEKTLDPPQPSLGKCS